MSIKKMWICFSVESGHGGSSKNDHCLSQIEYPVDVVVVEGVHGWSEVFWIVVTSCARFASRPGSSACSAPLPLHHLALSLAGVNTQGKSGTPRQTCPWVMSFLLEG